MKRFVAARAEVYDQQTRKQCLRIYKDHFAMQNTCWEIPNLLLQSKTSTEFSQPHKLN